MKLFARHDFLRTVLLDKIVSNICVLGRRQIMRGEEDDEEARADGAAGNDDQLFFQPTPPVTKGKAKKQKQSQSEAKRAAEAEASRARAVAHKNKLLRFAKTEGRRTNIIDDQVG